MEYLKSRKFWEAVLVRTVKTMAEAALGSMGGCAMFHQVDFRIVASSAVFAGIVTVFAALKGLPEVDIEVE